MYAVFGYEALPLAARLLSLNELLLFLNYIDNVE